MKTNVLLLSFILFSIFLLSCEKKAEVINQTITITEPIGGEEWIKGQSYTIKWTYIGITGEIQIRLDYPGSSNSLDNVDIATGQYTFTVPTNFSSRDDWAVAITAFGVTPSGGDIYDWSEKISIKDEAIGQPITITEPQIGEVWIKGQSHTIKWTSTGIIGSVQIRLDYPGSSNTLDNVNIANGQYTFTVPTNFPSRDDWAVAITAFGVTPSGGDIYDWSEKISIEDGAVGNLYAYYPFSGNAQDESGNGYNGTIQGATMTTDRHGNSNNAYAFNTNYIEIPSNALNNMPKGTVTAFIYLNNLGIQHSILDKTITTSINYFQFIVDNYNKLRAIINTNGGSFLGNTALSANQWYHVAVTWDGTNIIFYLNGIQDGSYANIKGIPDADRHTYIGKVENNTAYMKGKIDEVRIYNKALSQIEIQELANE
jgi:hypothetical protein